MSELVGHVDLERKPFLSDFDALPQVGDIPAFSRSRKLWLPTSTLAGTEFEEPCSFINAILQWNSWVPAGVYDTLTRLWFLLTIAVLVSCSSKKPESRPTAELAPVGVKERAACDFSEFNPVHFTDWLPAGILKQLPPTYPPQAKSAGIHGRVVVEALIDARGDVERACGTGDPTLSAAAEEAARKWKFRTPALNGRKLPYIQESFSFDFVLDPLITGVK